MSHFAVDKYTKYILIGFLASAKRYYSKESVNVYYETKEKLDLVIMSDIYTVILGLTKRTKVTITCLFSN